MLFKVNLREAHKRSGKSKYQVQQDTGLAYNTIVRYVDSSGVFLKGIPKTVLTLCDYYGVDWRNPEIVELIEDEETESESPLLAVT